MDEEERKERSSYCSRTGENKASVTDVGCRLVTRPADEAAISWSGLKHVSTARSRRGYLAMLAW